MSGLHYHATSDGSNGSWRGVKLPVAELAAEEASLEASVLVGSIHDASGAVTTGEAGNGRWSVTWLAPDGELGEQVFGWVPCNGDCDDPKLTVRAEVWPAVADDEGRLWLASGDEPWVSQDLRVSRDWNQVTTDILASHGIDVTEQLPVIHSTSWRPEESWILLTIGVALDEADVIGRWPGASPIPADVLDDVGLPRTHAAHDVPEVRDIDVLLHMLGHFSHLLAYSATERAKFSPAWRSQLRRMRPTLAGMYQQLHAA